MSDISTTSVFIHDVKTRSRRISAYESRPICLEHVKSGQSVLRHNITLLRRLGIAEIAYIGDYHLEKVIEECPGISVYRSTAELCSPLGVFESGVTKNKPRILMMRSDLVLNEEVVSSILNEDMEVVLGTVEEPSLTPFERDVLSRQGAGGRYFSGIVGVKSSTSIETLRSILESNSVAPEFDLNTVVLVDVSECFETIYPPSKKSRKLFGNKARTLLNFAPLISKAQIPPVFIVTRDSWTFSRSQTISDLVSAYSCPVVVRSSSSVEDSWDASAAGKFLSVLNIDIADQEKLASSIDRVFDSYPDSQNFEEDVLVQSFIADATVSGVIFTRGLENGAPYYFITFDDESGSTDTVTSGETNNIQGLVVLKAANDYSRLESWQRDLMMCVRELEKLADHDALDIEFAVDSKGVVNVLQARPIVKASYDSRLCSDLDFQREHASARQIYEESLEPFLLSDMSDWNPAEMIGAMPRPLQFSLYKYLITDEVWWRARAQMGYTAVQQELMVSILGHPYIVVDRSINSLTPDNLADQVRDNLKEAAKEKLRCNPQLHDKIEFEIVPTCYSPRTEALIQSLVSYGLAEEYVDDIRTAYIQHTDKVIAESVNRFQEAELNVRSLSDKLDYVLGSIESASVSERLHLALRLLKECREVGLIEFSIAARCGFIAMDYLKGFVDSGAFSDQDFTEIVASVRTIASSFLGDFDLLAAGQMPEDLFVEKYGHLRPSSYDIRSKNYKERLREKSISFVSTAGSRHNSSGKDDETLTEKRSLMDDFLLDHQFSVRSDELFGFIRSAIFFREEFKYEFTKVVDFVLEVIARCGQELGLDRELSSYLELEDLRFLDDRGFSPSNFEEVIRRVKFRNKQHDIYMLHELPSFLRSREDFNFFSLSQEQANFITKQIVQGEVVEIDEGFDVDASQLEGKIVLIRSADPGFDWIFSTNLLGLITMYGGAGSHMAIRCAELSVPAAIGVGKAMYEQVRSGQKTICVDCERGLIKGEN